MVRGVMTLLRHEPTCGSSARLRLTWEAKASALRMLLLLLQLVVLWRVLHVWGRANAAAVGGYTGCAQISTWWTGCARFGVRDHLLKPVQH